MLPLIVGDIPACSSCERFSLQLPERLFPAQSPRPLCLVARRPWLPSPAFAFTGIPSTRGKVSHSLVTPLQAGPSDRCCRLAARTQLRAHMGPAAGSAFHFSVTSSKATDRHSTKAEKQNHIRFHPFVPYDSSLPRKNVCDRLQPGLSVSGSAQDALLLPQLLVLRLPSGAIN